MKKKQGKKSHATYLLLFSVAKNVTYYVIFFIYTTRTLLTKKTHIFVLFRQFPMPKGLFLAKPHRIVPINDGYGY